MGDVLDLIGVSVVRNETTLLDEVTWTVREGERWVLLGPNGAGKTTLLQIAGARLHPTKGTARILDETLGAVDVFDLRPRIGLSSAAFAETLPSHERVADVVLTAAYAVAGRWNESYDPLDHRRSGDLLAAFGVAHLADRTFGTLSEGERKRVQLARSLMTDPELVLLDEPAAGLDLGGRETLVQDLSELARDKRSPVLVLVTHHVEEIPPGFTHGLLLRSGRVVAAGPLETVLTDDTLSATFDVPLGVTRTDGRWAARIRTRADAVPPTLDTPAGGLPAATVDDTAHEPAADGPVVLPDTDEAGQPGGGTAPNTPEPGTGHDHHDLAHGHDEHLTFAGAEVVDAALEQGDGVDAELVDAGFVDPGHDEAGAGYGGEEETFPAEPAAGGHDWPTAREEHGGSPFDTPGATPERSLFDDRDPGADAPAGDGSDRTWPGMFGAPRGSAAHPSSEPRPRPAARPGTEPQAGPATGPAQGLPWRGAAPGSEGTERVSGDVPQTERPGYGGPRQTPPTPEWVSLHNR